MFPPLSSPSPLQFLSTKKIKAQNVVKLVGGDVIFSGFENLFFQAKYNISYRIIYVVIRDVGSNHQWAKTMKK